MSLQKQVLYILAGIWILILLAIYSGSRLMLTKHFRAIEASEVVTATNQAARAFNNKGKSLNLLSSDWGLWDDAWDFMQNKSEKFIQANITTPFFQNANINILLFLKPDGSLFYGKNYDSASGKYLNLPANLIELLNNENIAKSVIKTKKVHSGIIRLSSGYLMFSASPILKSSKTGSINGIVIMGYFLNKNHIEQISQSAFLPMTFFPLPIKSAVLSSNEALTRLKYSQYAAIPNNDNEMYGYTYLKDPTGDPIALLRITSPRTMLNQAISTINYYLFVVVIFGIIILSILWLLLKILILDRLINVSNQVISINLNSTFSKRIVISGHDELTGMVNALNSLLEIIDLTEDQLKSRIANRTNQLEHLSVLNKNLFEEVNRQRSTEEDMRTHEKSLMKYAYYDQLTGLPNRMYFREQVQKLIERAEKKGSSIVVMFLDSDKFKSINDTYGHAVGDAFLCHIASSLKKVIKDSDIVARYAGDEFVVFLNNMREKSVIKHSAEKILKAASSPFSQNGIEIHTSFSLGISIYPTDGTNIHELEKSADLAMYHAKNKTGNVYCFSDSPSDCICLSDS